MGVLSGVVETSIDFATTFGISIGIFAMAAIVYLAASRGLSVVESRKHLPGPLVASLRQIARWLIGVAAVAVLLQTMGALQSVFAAVTGVFALLAIGFVAVWSVLSNTLCSLILLIVRPFRVGDALRFPPDEWGGRVVNFNMLYTTLETEDGSVLQVPNNMFFQRPMLRTKGRQQISLGDQLYREENAQLGVASRMEEGRRVDRAHQPGHDPALKEADATLTEPDFSV